MAFGQFLEGDYVDILRLDSNKVLAAVLKYLPDMSLNDSFIRLSKTNNVESIYRGIAIPGITIDCNLPSLEKIA